MPRLNLRREVAPVTISGFNQRNLLSSRQLLQLFLARDRVSHRIEILIMYEKMFAIPACEAVAEILLVN